jgi:hypothetical protein
MWVVTFWPVPIISRRGVGRALSAPLSVETTVLSTSDPLIPCATTSAVTQFEKRAFSQFEQIAQLHIRERPAIRA